MALGRNQKGLYTFDDIDKFEAGKVACFSLRFRATNKKCWQTRLGLPNPKILDYFNNNNMIVQICSFRHAKICTSYQIGKASKLPFLSRECTNSFQ